MMVDKRCDCWDYMLNEMRWPAPVAAAVQGYTHIDYVCYFNSTDDVCGCIDDIADDEMYGGIWELIQEYAHVKTKDIFDLIRSIDIKTTSFWSDYAVYNSASYIDTNGNYVEYCSDVPSDLRDVYPRSEIRMAFNTFDAMHIGTTLHIQLMMSPSSAMTIAHPVNNHNSNWCDCNWGNMLSCAWQPFGKVIVNIPDIVLRTYESFRDSHRAIISDLLHQDS